MPEKRTLKLPPRVLFVLGAGVDFALGLPLMNTLFRDLHAFAKGEGKAVDKAIRKHVNVRVNLATLAADDGENLASKLLGSRADLLPVIQKALKKHPQQKDDNVRTLKMLIDKFHIFVNANSLPDGMVSQFQKIAGEGDSELTANTLLDTDHIAFQKLPRQAMRKIFTAVLADLQTLTPVERSAFEAIVTALSNFEEMLGDLFTGYFTKNLSDQKRYFYLAWLLWAYIRVCEHKGFSKRDHSFYKTLSDVETGSDVITFNYTNFFFAGTRPANGYFHGDARSYIRFDTREYITNDKAANSANTVDKIADFISGLPVDWNQDVPQAYLPGIVPPLSVKPIICTEYLDRWYECGQMIKRAKSIAILGYSFSVADEHFNDLIRKQNPIAPLFVINPTIEPVIDQVCRITETDRKHLTARTVDGSECMKGGRLTFIKARAEEITAAQLMKLLSH